MVEYSQILSLLNPTCKDVQKPDELSHEDEAPVSRFGVHNHPEDKKQQACMLRCVPQSSIAIPTQIY